MSNITFQDVIDIIQKVDEDPSSFSTYVHQIIEFSKEINGCADAILDRKSDEYFLMFLSAVSSLSMTEMMQDGLPAKRVARMVQNPEVTRFAFLLVRMTIGLSVMEELR